MYESNLLFYTHQQAVRIYNFSKILYIFAAIVHSTRNIFNKKCISFVENTAILLKDIKDDVNKLKDILCSQVGRFRKAVIFPQLSVQLKCISNVSLNRILKYLKN